MKQPKPIKACGDCHDYEWVGTSETVGKAYCNHEAWPMPREISVPMIDETHRFPSWCPLPDVSTDAFVCSRCGVEYDNKLKCSCDRANDGAKEPKP